ncbi:MAG: HlyD family efflux transporter periplasmic adaptor subunit [Oscillospiraceae bacterium]|nr:HlyD family efflux transporter periplasmic adaptor subunit [Oscillospiraceae bacterium]
METAKKKKRRNAVFAVVAILLAALLVLIPFLLDARQNSGKPDASILSAEVRRGDLRKTLSGTGTLEEQEAEEVTVPQGVKVTEYLVENGQFVREGDPVASVDRVSVMEAISTLRGVMDEVALEMQTLKSGSDYSYLSAAASGRVKAVYAKAGDAVQDVVLQNGALAVVSLDGMMAVRFRAGGGLGIGKTVTVVLSDGTETDGRVETVIDGEATATIADSFGSIGETVQIRSQSGEALGSGTLYVHSAWKAIATEGIVNNVYIEKERIVSAYGTMFVLSGTSSGGDYEVLASEHRQYEDIMADLFRMYQDGILKAPCDGCVSGVDDGILELLSVDGSSAPALKLLANAPVDNQDGSFANVIGIVTGSDSAMLQAWNTEIPDYTDTAFLVTAVESFTNKYSGGFAAAYQWVSSETEKEVYTEFTGDAFDGGPYFEKSDEASDEAETVYIVTEDGEMQPDKTYYTKSTVLVEGGSWTPASVRTGGIYAFAFDKNDNLVFLVYLGSSDTLPKDASDEKKTDEKKADEEKTGGGSGRGQSGGAGGGGMPSGGIDLSGLLSGGGAAGGSGAGGFSGSASAAQETRYSTTGTAILSVTPQETVTVSITIDELDILYVRAGQEAVVTLDALPGQSFSGVITRVNTTASNEGGNSKYSAVVELTRNGHMLGGMNASANITIEERKDVLLIPAAALTEQNGESVVYTAFDSKTETLAAPVTVETGLSDGDRVQIFSGLQEGNTVWYSYYDTLEIQGLPEGFPLRGQ